MTDDTRPDGATAPQDAPSPGSGAADHKTARASALLQSLASTPPIPQAVLDRLPGPIRRALPLFAARAERDVFATAALGVLSGTLPRVWGRYDTGLYAPGLFVIVTAPAASGKGVMSHARRLGDEIEALFMDEYAEAKKAANGAAGQTSTWDDDMDVPHADAPHAQGKADKVRLTGPGQAEPAATPRLLFDADMTDVIEADLRPKAFRPKPKTADQNVDPNEDDTPPLRRLYLSGDISSSALVMFMDQNGASTGEGFGIVFETEIDTVVKSQRQEWGGTSDVLRKAHAHETVSLLRVGKERGGEGRKISRPTLAVVLAGTPNQVLRLIPSSEDGLFSRFLFLGFLPENPLVWKDVMPREDGPDPAVVLAEGAREVRRLWTVLEGRSSDLGVKLTRSQWDALNARMQTVKAKLFRHFDYAGASTAHRTGLHVFRIASVLAVWRAFENGVDLGRVESVTVADEDFDAALQLAVLYARHAVAVLKALPRESRFVMPSDQMALYRGLPEAFRTAEAIATGSATGVAERTVKDWLGTWAKTGRLRRVKHGFYEKPELAETQATPTPTSPTPQPEASDDDGSEDDSDDGAPADSDGHAGETRLPGNDVGGEDAGS